MRQEGFSLVLSGGGALGCAHLGVLDFLESQYLVPKEIVGTSMGALVGAAFSCGLTADEIAGQFARVARFTNWVRVSWTRPGLLDTEKLASLFTDLFGERTFADTRIPFTAAATDFDSGETRLFNKKDPILLRDGLLCSMSIPVVFPPVPLEGRHYVDGFLSANLAMDGVSNPGSRILAVDVMSEKSLPLLKEDRSFFKRAKILARAYDRAFFLLVQNQTKLALQGRNKLYLIRPELSGFKVYRFDQWEKMRRLGYEAARLYFQA